MGKMSELDAGLNELRKCGEKIIAISEMISAMFSTDDEPPKEVKAKVITLEEVRKVLADKSLSGYRSEVKNLITSFGAEKLSGIESSKYEELLAKAEVIGNA